MLPVMRFCAQLGHGGVRVSSESLTQGRQSVAHVSSPSVS